MAHKPTSWDQKRPVGKIALGTEDVEKVAIVDASGNQITNFGGSAGLTDAQLRASPVEVTGGGGGTEYTEAATDTTITGGVVMWEDASDTIRAVSAAKPLPISVASVPSHAVTGPLTDAELRATAVPVSGTVTASGPLTDAQLRASAVPISVTTVPSHAVTNAGTFAVQETGTGYTTHRSIDLDEGALEVVKASAGTVYGMWVTNTATTTRWIKFYDATSGTAGTGTPKITIGIPGNATDDVSGNFGPGGRGIAFATGICVGCTIGVADADTGAPAANDCIVNIFFV